jgi:hypothetical protein
MWKKYDAARAYCRCIVVFAGMKKGFHDSETLCGK